MKFLLIVSLLGFSLQSFSEEKIEINSSVQSMLSTYASEVANCDVDELNIDSLSSLKSMCKSLINSDLCSGVNPEHLIDCDNLILEDNEYSFGSIFQSQEQFNQICSDLADEQQEKSWESFKNMAIFMGAVGVRIAGLHLFGEIEWATESIDNFKSSWNSIVVEADRLEEEEQVDPKMSLMRVAFVDPAVNEFKAENCLKTNVRVTQVCANMLQGGAVGAVSRTGGSVLSRLFGKNRLGSRLVDNPRVFVNPRSITRKEGVLEDVIGQVEDLKRDVKKARQEGRKREARRLERIISVGEEEISKLRIQIAGLKRIASRERGLNSKTEELDIVKKDLKKAKQEGRTEDVKILKFEVSEIENQISKERWMKRELKKPNSVHREEIYRKLEVTDTTPTRIQKPDNN